MDPLSMIGLGASAIRGASSLLRGATGSSAFSTALNAARASHPPVRLADGAGLALTDAQLARVAPLASKAEAEGAGRAVVLIDGQALLLDVATRTITGSATAQPGSDGGISTGIDAVITVPSSGANATELLRSLGGNPVAPA